MAGQVTTATDHKNQVRPAMGYALGHVSAMEALDIGLGDGNHPTPSDNPSEEETALPLCAKREAPITFHDHSCLMLLPGVQPMTHGLRHGLNAE
eukprot:CAMPEP_0174384734 /NCGR_PEP_ID=MMETSP0811_2-20130205/126118_1 /TAXON_ID=73025 ORGANISM="Eutreptiella gymnastica-like, Strain CCMP1594" /NCGR_SAMPLE_ID=MMETSP0811_2 /ASSEMBLY_ACC=CAM_ASM_000667 /LENGTH=93 /DNA_ID=CAMNT_0015538789 /DNA_START=66 /DNA_END=348 /DNA_ORIENTATION=-